MPAVSAARAPIFPAAITRRGRTRRPDDGAMLDQYNAAVRFQDARARRLSMTDWRSSLPNITPRQCELKAMLHVRNGMRERATLDKRICKLHF